MKWKQRINNLSIKKKIIFYCYMVVTPILLFISAVMFQVNYSKISKEQNMRSINRVQNLDNSLAELNQSVSEMSTYICINSDILNILKSNEVEELNKKPKLWRNEAPIPFIRDTLAIKGYIKTLGIYPENGVQPYLCCLDSSSHISTLDKIKETEMYQEALRKKGKKSWKLISKNSSDVYWANQSEKIVFYREIYDLSKKKALGYLVIGADAAKYLDICKSAMESETEGILVLNSEGEKLLSCGVVVSELEKNFIKEFNQQQINRKNTSILEYKDKVVYLQSNDDSGQIVFIFTSKSDIVNQLIGIAFAPILMLFGILIGLFPVLSLVSNIVTKPLKKVNLAMAEFRKGDFEQQVEVETSDEVGEVASCFNQMVTDIKQLIDEKYVMELREKESELTALQAQINPHFLYNTLDSLYWQAQEANHEEIAENILALSNLFRQVLGEGKSITTVYQEIDLVKQYLIIQKMRFTKRLEYKIDMEAEIENECIPKLILQPFVENAVVHGFENMDVPCSIYVGGRTIPNGIEFIIEDTGIGMNEEQVKAILNTDDGESYKGHRIGRYAIKNVKERLTLMYHERFEMKVDSAPGKGTKIILRIFREKGLE